MHSIGQQYKPFLLLGSVGASSAISLSRRMRSLLVSTTKWSTRAPRIALNRSVWLRVAPVTTVSTTQPLINFMHLLSTTKAKNKNKKSSGGWLADGFSLMVDFLAATGLRIWPSIYQMQKKCKKTIHTHTHHTPLHHTVKNPLHHTVKPVFWSP